MIETVPFPNGKIISWDPEIMRAVARIMENPNSTGMYQKGNLDFARSLIKRPKVVVEVGAHIGLNTVHYSDWAEIVIAFEALEVNFKCLQKNISQNQCSNVELYNKAVGSRTGFTSLKVPKSNTGTSHIIEGNDIAMIRIDDLIDSQVEFVKIDCEGYEWEVLQGASQLIKRCAPILQIELIDRHLARYGTDSKTVIEWFLERKFRAYLRTGLELPQKMFVSGARPTDIFFIPEEHPCLKS